MTINVVQRPAFFSGCLQTWTETTTPNVIRSGTESGNVIVRRRTTAIVRTGDASIVIKGADYDDFQQFFLVTCMGGVNATKFKFPPDGREQVWRFSGPPVYEWGKVDKGNHVVRVSFALERLPGWEAYD